MARHMLTPIPVLDYEGSEAAAMRIGNRVFIFTKYDAAREITPQTPWRGQRVYHRDEILHLLGEGSHDALLLEPGPRRVPLEDWMDSKERTRNWQIVLDSALHAEQMRVQLEQQQKEGEREYRVKWVIEVYADNPHAAATKALRIQRNATSSATVFEVQPYPPETGDDPWEVIDLDEC